MFLYLKIMNECEHLYIFRLCYNILHQSREIIIAFKLRKERKIGLYIKEF